jgi:hypothetical protein
VLVGHPGLGQFEQRRHVGYEIHGFVDCLTDHLLLVLPIHRAQNLLKEEPPQFRLFHDPIGMTIEGKLMVKEKRPREIAMIMIRRQGDIPGLLRRRPI